MIHCANCGAVIGPGHSSSREPESCGEKDCDRAVRDMYRQMDDEAQENAREDNYERYR